jgi:hypothetical protein
MVKIGVILMGKVQRLREVRGWDEGSGGRTPCKWSVDRRGVEPLTSSVHAHPLSY